jgi:hypothetical protein
MNSNELNKILKAKIDELSGAISINQYREIADIFQKLVEASIKDIWKKHNNKVQLSLNDVPICLEGSAVNTSTAFGFMIEEFLVRQLPNFFTRSINSTINSVEDFSYIDDSKIELMVNLKVEKNTSNNNGIVAGNILRNRYIANDKPKLYLVLKSKYHLDEQHSDLHFDGTISYYLESFITRPNCLRADSRNWSSEYNILSGRLQAPNRTELSQCGINSIPEPELIRNFINNLADNLRTARNS